MKTKLIFDYHDKKIKKLQENENTPKEISFGLSIRDLEIINLICQDLNISEIDINPDNNIHLTVNSNNPDFLNELMPKPWFQKIFHDKIKDLV